MRGWREGEQFGEGEKGKEKSDWTRISAECEDGASTMGGFACSESYAIHAFTFRSPSYAVMAQHES